MGLLIEHSPDLADALLGQPSLAPEDLTRLHRPAVVIRSIRRALQLAVSTPGFLGSFELRGQVGQCLLELPEPAPELGFGLVGVLPHASIDLALRLGVRARIASEHPRVGPTVDRERGALNLATRLANKDDRHRTVREADPVFEAIRRVLFVMDDLEVRSHEWPSKRLDALGVTRRDIRSEELRVLLGRRDEAHYEVAARILCRRAQASHSHDQYTNGEERPRQKKFSHSPRAHALFRPLDVALLGGVDAELVAGLDERGDLDRDAVLEHRRLL